MKYPFLLSLVLIFSLTSCRSGNKKPVKRAFYFWKQSFSLNEIEYKALKDFSVTRFYIKIFDVGQTSSSHSPIIAPISWQDSLPNFMDWVPCIFITNEFLLNKSPDQIDSLAGFLSLTISHKIKEARAPTPHEIQFDCDWSGKSKENYFSLLRALRKALDPSYSFTATIRLHQLKYWEKTGVPPVDRGMLMYYNMSNIKEVSTYNSIIDNKVGKSYITQKKYPLKLDFALPIFQWGVFFDHENFVGIFNHFTQQKIDSLNCFRPGKNHIFIVEKPKVFGDTYLRMGNKIRLENVQQHDLFEALDNLQPFESENGYRTLFYWDLTTINDFGYEAINPVFNYPY